MGIHEIARISSQLFFIIFCEVSEVQFHRRMSVKMSPTPLQIFVGGNIALWVVSEELLEARKSARRGSRS